MFRQNAHSLGTEERLAMAVYHAAGAMRQTSASSLQPWTQ